MPLKTVQAETAAVLAAQAAQQFLDHYHATGGYLGEAITTLCELATADDLQVAAQGLRGIFPFLVERLSDAFRPEYCPLYDRAFAQIVQHCRALPAGRRLDAELRRFGLATQHDLLARKVRQRSRRSRLDPSGAARIRKVLIPSRVTIGADVAVTSVFVAAVKEALPRAQIVLLAPPVTRELFAGDGRVRVREVHYRRDGGLVRRLNAWLDVLAAAEAELAGLAPEAYLVVDPDSRLTQLGLLPLAPDESREWFFESRGYPGRGCVSRLAADWLADHFSLRRTPRPFVPLRAADLVAGRDFVSALRQSGARESVKQIVMVSFGVGDNPNKRVPDPFEARLLSALVAEGATVLLAKGVSAAEIGRAERHIAELQAAGRRVCRVGEEDMVRRKAGDALLDAADVVAFEGRLGLFCALIAASDRYIGYDSAGQHIAAALGVPTVDIFADPHTPIAKERWRPCGSGAARVRVIEADALLRDGVAGGLDRVLGQVLDRRFTEKG